MLPGWFQVALTFILTGVAYLKTKEFDADFPKKQKVAAYMTTADGKVPEGIVNFTLCMWIKPYVLDKNMCLFSYCGTKPTDDCNDLSFFFQPYQDSSQLYVGDKFCRVRNPTYKKEVWQHFCVLYDGDHFKVSMIYNGYSKYDMYSKNNIKKLGPGYKLSGKGKIVIGQDQDTYGGGFQKAQGAKGRISRMQWWDKILDDEEVQAQLECNAPEGNIMAWTKTDWEFKDGCTKEDYEPCLAKDACPGVDNRITRRDLFGPPRGGTRKLMKIFNGTAYYGDTMPNLQQMPTGWTELRLSNKEMISKNGRVKKKRS